MKKFTYSYYNPYEYPDDITAFGTCDEVLARSLTDAFALENVPIECLETLQIDGISFKSYVVSTSLRDWLKDRLFTMSVKGELHLLSDESFNIIRNL
nr:MAG: hypothetical protein [Bacteriophage sp.]